MNVAQSGGTLGGEILFPFGEPFQDWTLRRESLEERVLLKWAGTGVCAHAREAEALAGAAEHQVFIQVLVQPAVELSSQCAPRDFPALRQILGWQGIRGEWGTAGEHGPQHGG